MSNKLAVSANLVVLCLGQSVTADADKPYLSLAAAAAEDGKKVDGPCP